MFIPSVQPLAHFRCNDVYPSSPSCGVFPLRIVATRTAMPPANAGDDPVPLPVNEQKPVLMEIEDPTALCDGDLQTLSFPEAVYEGVWTFALEAKDQARNVTTASKPRKWGRFQARQDHDSPSSGSALPTNGSHTPAVPGNVPSPVPKKLCRYAGLVPSTHQSADRSYHGRIIKEGNGWLKWTMVEAAIHAVRKDGYMKRFYERLQKTKGTGKARIAVARKLLKIVYWMLREKQDYTTVLSRMEKDSKTSWRARVWGLAN